MKETPPDSGAAVRKSLPHHGQTTASSMAIPQKRHCFTPTAPISDPAFTASPFRDQRLKCASDRIMSGSSKRATQRYCGEGVASPTGISKLDAVPRFGGPLTRAA